MVQIARIVMLADCRAAEIAPPIDRRPADVYVR